MLLKKITEFDNVRRGVIPGLDGVITKDAKGNDIENPEVDTQREMYFSLRTCPVGGEVEIENQETADWLIKHKWFVDPNMEGVKS